MFKQDNILTTFKLPIEYNNNKKEILPSMKADLELDVCKSVEKPLYHYVFNPESRLAKIIANKYNNYYTNDKKFLTNTQQLISNSNNYFLKNNEEISDKIYSLWHDIKNDDSFLEKYQYIDIDYFKFLNNNDKFLQFLSIFNLTSPVLSLSFPIVMLFIPFLLIKMQDSRVTFDNYLKFLKIIIARNSIGNLIVNFTSVPLDKKIYLCISAGLYIFQLYQNLSACVRFYKNIKKIHEQLFTFRDYIITVIENIDKHLLISDKLECYQEFNYTLREKKATLQELLSKLEEITPYKLNMTKLNNIGQLMKCYYIVFDNKFYNDAIVYSMGFTGYIETLNNLNYNIQNKIIGKCNYTNKSTEFKNSYYPPLVKLNNKIIKNSYKLKKNKIITGPNASGKTTLLKSTLFNIILSQQIGFGFYSNAKINIYDFVHCYLNIPDTSGRDSLFQAEARRCKEILDNVIKNKDLRHFCIFDELYSGTNPYEAISGAYAYLSYLTKYKKFNFLLTTHYVSLCEKIEKNKYIENAHMIIDLNKERNKDDEKLNYTYKLGKGISKVKGGINVFRDLDYPTAIVNIMKKEINNAL